MQHERLMGLPAGKYDRQWEKYPALKSRETELLSFKTLAGIAGEFIKYLEVNQDAFIDRGLVKQAPPRFLWFTERLRDLYPEILDPHLGFKIDRKVRTGFIEIKTQVLRALQEAADRGYVSRSEMYTEKDKTNHLKHLGEGSAHLVEKCLNLIRVGLESHGLDPKELHDLDCRYTRLNLFRRPAPYFTLIRAGGLTDLLEVIGYYARLMHDRGLARVADLLEGDRLLKWNFEKGAPELKYATASDAPPSRYPTLDQALSHLGTVEFAERRRNPLLHVPDEMPDEVARELMIQDFLDPGRDSRRVTQHYWLMVNHFLLGHRFPNHGFTSTIFSWKKLKDDFIESNALVQSGKDHNEWEIVFDGADPVRIKHVGLKCIAYLLQNPYRDASYRKLIAIMGDPAPRTRRRVNSKYLHARRLQTMRVRNTIFSKKDGALSAIEKECPSFAEHLRTFLPEPKKNVYKYVGDKFSFLNVNAKTPK